MYMYMYMHLYSVHVYSVHLLLYFSIFYFSFFPVFTNDIHCLLEPLLLITAKLLEFSYFIRMSQTGAESFVMAILGSTTILEMQIIIGSKLTHNDCILTKHMYNLLVHIHIHVIIIIIQYMYSGGNSLF